MAARSDRRDTTLRGTETRYAGFIAAIGLPKPMRDQLHPVNAVDRMVEELATLVINGRLETMLAAAAAVGIEMARTRR